MDDLYMRETLHISEPVGKCFDQWKIFKGTLTGRWKIEIYDESVTLYLEVFGVFPIFKFWIPEYRFKFIRRNSFINDCTCGDK